MLPTGTVTFLMTDVEGSTGLVERLGDDWERVLALQRQLVRKAVTAAGGEEIEVHGDEVFAAFAYASGAAAAAADIQRRFAAERWSAGEPVRVRIGLHTGEPRLTDEGYLGLDVHLVARVCAAAHGGQVLLSRATAELLDPKATMELGEHQLKGITRPTVLFQLAGDGLVTTFPPLRAARLHAGLVEDRERELADAALAAVRPPGPLTRALRRRRRRGFADVAWEARARRWRMPPPVRDALTDAASTLFAAARAAADADRLVLRTDSRALTRRLDEYRGLATISRAAEVEVANVQRQLDLLGQVRAGRDALAAARDGIDTAVTAAQPSAEQLARAVGPVRTAGAELAARVDAAQTVLGDTATRLRRTSARGVYRLGDLYAVPFVDSVGLDRMRRFDSRREAREFAYSLRIVEGATGRTTPRLPRMESSAAADT